MTGKHPARINITDWIPGMNPKDEKLLGAKDLNELPLAEVTISEIFKNAGYKTFFAGKWHLGGDGYYPEDQGFDINIGGHEKGQPPGGYYSPYKNPKLADGPDGEYLTDRLTDESVKFLNNVGDKPFFLFLSYYTVHTPIQANKRHIVKFKEKASELGKEENLLRTEGSGLEWMQMEPNTLKSHVSRLRKRFRHCVREEVARTLADPAQTEEEMRSLLAVLQKR